MLTHVPGYNVTTDSIRSKTVKDSYVKWDAGVLVNAVTTTNSSLTLDNSHDSFYINNSNAATISVTILDTINDYTEKGNNSLRRVNVIIDSRSASSDRTVTFTIPSTFTLLGGLSATRNLYHGNLQVFVVEIVNNTVNIYDGVGSYFEVDSNGDLMPLSSSADLVPRTDLSGQLGTGDKRWAKVYAGNITNTYDSVADMVSDTSLKEGSTAFTLGYHNPNDGGSGVYNIRAAVSGETYDDGSLIQLDNNNVAELITDGRVNVKQFGAYGNGTTTDDTAFQNIATYASAKNLIMLVPPATYKVTATITGTFGTFGDVTIIGGGTVDIVNLKDVAEDAQDSADAAATSESNALSYRNAAQTSAAAAAASASSASTTATQLMAYLEDKETLTAPAEDAKSTAKSDASNIGANAETDNSEDWGDALGGGAVASGEKRLVTGGTVYDALNNFEPEGNVASDNDKTVSGSAVYTEVRPAADGTYAKTAQTTAQNVIALDTQVKNNTDAIDVRLEIQNNAGFHNSIYRGKNLGADVTDEQWAAIKAGTFDDLFIGDYWSKKISYTYYKATADTEAVAGKTYYADVNGTALDEQPEAGADISEAGYCELVSTSNQSINFRIAGFDYCLNTGDANTTAHHIVIVPDTAFLNVSINKTNTTEGGYVGSDFYTGNNGIPGLVAAKAAVNAAFGSEHILSHKIYLDNAVTSGRPSAGAWYASTVELMNEHMVYGGKFFEHANSGTIPTIYAVEKGQLPLFALDHSRITNRGSWWLRCVVSGSCFAFVSDAGIAGYFGASAAVGVRPYFAIYKS